MEYRFQFSSEEEKENIIKENANLYVIGYEFLLEEGNYIVMSDKPSEFPEPTEINILENKISILEEQNTQLKEELNLTQNAVNELLFSSL